jgi:nucleoside 2-deoxyribosyltransferase
MKLYLAGDMHSGWQDELIAALGSGFDVIDPRNQPKTDDHGIYTAWDLAGVRECDALAAFMSARNPSGYGLCVEVGYAHALGKRVLFIDAAQADWRSKYFGMVRAIASASVADIPKAAALLKKWNAA